MNWYPTKNRTSLGSGFCSFAVLGTIYPYILLIDLIKSDFDCFADGIINIILIHGCM